MFLVCLLNVPLHNSFTLFYTTSKAWKQPSVSPWFLGVWMVSVLRGRVDARWQHRAETIKQADLRGLAELFWHLLQLVRRKHTTEMLPVHRFLLKNKSCFVAWIHLNRAVRFKVTQTRIIAGGLSHSSFVRSGKKQCLESLLQSHHLFLPLQHECPISVTFSGFLFIGASSWETTCQKPQFHPWLTFSAHIRTQINLLFI